MREASDERLAAKPGMPVLARKVPILLERSVAATEEILRPLALRVTARAPSPRPGGCGDATAEKISSLLATSLHLHNTIDAICLGALTIIQPIGHSYSGTDP